MQSPIEVCAWSGLEELRPVLERFLATRCRDDSEVDDVVQETLMRAARYRESLDDPGSLRSWAVRIALNVLRDHLRRERRLPRADAGDEALERIEGREPVPGDAQDEVQVALDGEVIERDRVLCHLHAAVASLREEDRAVLGSYYSEGGHSAETARVCEIAPALVKVRLFRARRRLLRVIQSRVTNERARAALPWPALPVIEPSRDTARAGRATFAGHAKHSAPDARGGWRCNGGSR